MSSKKSEYAGMRSTEDKLKSTLSITRRYVEWYEPKDVSEAHDRDLLLQDIDLLIGRRDG